MRVLSLLSRSFAQREHAMVRRVEIGLLDEGSRLTRCVPTGCSVAMASGLIPQATYSESGPAIALPWRADRLLRDLSHLVPEALRSGDEGEYDIVHAWGQECWDLAAEVADATGAALIVEVYSRSAVDQARRFERRNASTFPEPSRCVFAAPSEAIGRTLDRAGLRWPVRVVPWGVFVPEEPRRARRPGEPVSLCIVGSGDSRGATIPVLEALADLARRREAMESAGAGTIPDLMVFIDERIARGEPELWRYAEKLGLLGMMSIIADLEGQRGPTLQSDIVALPEASGTQRSIVLDAMASGLAVLAAKDELLADIEHESTGLIIEEPRARLWCDALERLLIEPEFALRLGDLARQHVATHRLASEQARVTLDLYRQVAGVFGNAGSTGGPAGPGNTGSSRPISATP